MNTKVRVAGLLLLVVGSALGGCNARYNELMETNRALTDRNSALGAEIETLTASMSQLQAAIDTRDRTIAEMRGLTGDMRSENQRLQDELERLGGRLSDIKFGQLDAATDQALRDLAAQYPDLIIYDPDRGMVRFTSDLTFASGSADVTEQGRQSLAAFGRILGSGTAASYDIRIVGHTDSQRMSPNTAQKHGSNWGLSAHRAISVMQEITKMGVGPERVEIAGRGEHMPTVANSSGGNTPQNRRVEIYLVRSASGRPVAPAPSGNQPAPPLPARTDDDMVK
ncbi:MAG: OmpA family protein [Phycisphaerales bacterium]|nr:OmpA family protein [Phycisphaerales bacterium]